MIAAKFDPQLFFQRPENVALRVPASEIFGLLKRSFVLPVQWGAMVTHSAGDQSVIRPGGTVDGADAEDVLFARATPVEVTCEEAEVPSLDGFLCRAAIRLSLSVIPERGELLTFARTVLGGHRVVQAASLTKYLGPALREWLSGWAGKRNAAVLIDARQAEAAGLDVAEALQAPLFAAGLCLEGRPVVSFESEAVREVRRVEEVSSRRRAEHDAARQVQESLERAQAAHLDHLTGLLSRAKDLAVASPELELPDLIRTFSERERGELYQSVFAAEPPSTTQWLVVADGEEILFFTPRQLDAPSRRLRIEGPAGAVRSVQVDGRGALYLGAATGVYRLPLNSAEPDLILLVPGAPPVKGGFNSVAVAGDHVVASHSELGLWEWNLGNDEATARQSDGAIGAVTGVERPEAKRRFETVNGRQLFADLTRKAKAVREARILDTTTYASIDNFVIEWNVDQDDGDAAHRYLGSVSTITALCPTTVGLLAGNSDGDVWLWDKPEARPQRLHTGTGRPVESIAFVETQGVRRIIYSDTSLCVHARVLGDNYVCRYEAGGQTIRRVDVAPDLIVATNDLRDRLIVWKPGEPAAPFATIPVSRITRRSIQDVSLVAGPETGPLRT